MAPVLKYVRGEHLSQDHWLDMFRLLGLPKGTKLEMLTFSDLLSVAETITEKALELKVQYTPTPTHILCAPTKTCTITTQFITISN